jgi:hypothetical protein
MNSLTTIIAIIKFESIMIQLQGFIYGLLMYLISILMALHYALDDHSYILNILIPYLHNFSIYTHNLTPIPHEYHLSYNRNILILKLDVLIL